MKPLQRPELRAEPIAPAAATARAPFDRITAPGDAQTLI